MIRIAPLLAILLLVACGGPRDDQGTDAAASEAVDVDFERRFNALQVRQSKLLPQLTAPGTIPPDKRERLHQEAGGILEDLRALGADPALTPGQISRVATEIANLETMVELYLPRG